MCLHIHIQIDCFPKDTCIAYKYMNGCGRQPLNFIIFSCSILRNLPVTQKDNKFCVSGFFSRVNMERGEKKSCQEQEHAKLCLILPVNTQALKEHKIIPTRFARLHKYQFCKAYTNYREFPLSFLRIQKQRHTQ